MNAKALVALLLLAGLGVALFVLPDAPSDGGGDPSGPASTARPVDAPSDAPDGSPDSCAACHPAVVAEWRGSMHAAAFTDPQVRAPGQSDNFRKTECLPCHASAPVFAYGIEEGSRVLARSARRHDGIDCLSCHGLPGGGVAASRAGLSGACQPIFEERIASQALCAPCHNQHQTHDEWRVSPAAAAGRTCRDCHMERVVRDASAAGGPRSGRSHAFLGGRHKEFALAGLELTHAVDRDAGTLTARLTNTFAGHNLPTDSRNRGLDLVVTLLDQDGMELPAAEGLGDRYPGGETGTARLRFRNPYRSSGNPSTQIPAGETRELVVPLPDRARRALVELVYKLEPWLPDTEAHWRHTVELDLAAGG